MITARAFAGKHYAVYGLARSGLATVEALLASGAKVTAWDGKEETRENFRSSRAKSRGAGTIVEVRPSTALGTNEVEICILDETDLSRFDSLVVTPGLPLNRHPIAARARDAGIEIIGDIELFARARPELPPHKVVGITGTNGKSTTTALVHHILETAGVPTTMGGNIGLPILAQDPLPPNENGVGVYVLELSSYQLDLTQSLDCDVAVLLNITPDHLDRYENFEAYVRSKEQLFAMQSWDREGIFGIDDPIAGALAGLTPVGSIKQRVAMSYVWHARATDVAELELSPALLGPHNAQNAAAALEIGRHLRLSRDSILAALRTFPGLPHRMERVSEKDSVLFVNDSKATNPTATAPALAAFPAIRWICGGQAKSDDLAECEPHFGHVRSAYTIGEAAELFERLLAPHMPVAKCETLENAVNRAAEDSQPGDTVLLSPACASFDQFRDFEDRGDRFKQLVEAL